MSSVLFSKKVFQEVQPMGGVGCRPSGSASLPERKKRKVVARTSICAKLVLLVVLWNNFNQSVGGLRWRVTQYCRRE